MTPEIDYDLLAIALMTNPTCRNILMSTYKGKVDIGDVNKTIKHEVRQHVAQTLSDLNITQQTKKELQTEVSAAAFVHRTKIQQEVNEFFSKSKFNFGENLENMLIAEIKKMAQTTIQTRIAEIQMTTSKKVTAAIKAAFNGISINLNGSDFLNDYSEPDSDWDDDD